MEKPKYILDLIAKGKEFQKTNKEFLKRAKNKKGIEKLLPKLHEEAFSKVDCLGLRQLLQIDFSSLQNT